MKLNKKIIIPAAIALVVLLLGIVVFIIIKSGNKFLDFNFGSHKSSSTKTAAEIAAEYDKVVKVNDEAEAAGYITDSQVRDSWFSDYSSRQIIDGIYSPSDLGGTNEEGIHLLDLYVKHVFEENNVTEYRELVTTSRPFSQFRKSYEVDGDKYYHFVTAFTDECEDNQLHIYYVITKSGDL